MDNDLGSFVRLVVATFIGATLALHFRDYALISPMEPTCVCQFNCTQEPTTPSKKFSAIQSTNFSLKSAEETSPPLAKAADPYPSTQPLPATPPRPSCTCFLGGHYNDVQGACNYPLKIILTSSADDKSYWQEDMGDFLQNQLSSTPSNQRIGKTCFYLESVVSLDEAEDDDWSGVTVAIYFVQLPHEHRYQPMPPDIEGKQLSSHECKFKSSLLCTIE